MNRSVFEPSHPLLEETKLRIWPETTMLNPSTEKLVLSWNPESSNRREEPVLCHALLLGQFLEFLDTRPRYQVARSFCAFEKLCFTWSSGWKSSCDFVRQRWFDFFV